MPCRCACGVARVGSRIAIRPRSERRRPPQSSMRMNNGAHRPPVLAHERFQAERASFTGLDLAARFQRIVDTNLWGAPTSVSGLGSEEAATAAVREALPQLLQRLEVRSLLDAPCGDAGWIADCIGHLDYTGVDIVPSLIAANIAAHQLRAPHGEVSGRFSGRFSGRSCGRFLTADITRDPLPACDLILCRDCLVHLSFGHIFQAIAQLQASGSKWLLTTHFPELEDNRDCEDGDWRALNMERAPFHWPAPAELINEQCAEGDGGWADKSLGLWLIADLPRNAGA